MSVRSVIRDIRAAATSSLARRTQFRNAIFDFTFNKIMTEDEAFTSVGTAIIHARPASHVGPRGLTPNEARILNTAVKQAYRNVYTRRNIIKVHKAKGYKVFAGRNSYTEQTKLVNYSGFNVSPSGKPLANRGRAAVYVHHQYSNPNMGGPMVTYAGSMNSISDRENREVINALWFTMIRETLKISRKLSGTPTPPSSTQAGRGIRSGATARRMGSSSGASRALRLHGPVASQMHTVSPFSVPMKTPTGATDDTSVPVVGMIDALRDINDNVLAGTVPPNIHSQAMYNKAFYDVMSELDLEFIVNNETITDIVTGQKEIIIKIAQGGQQHQPFMEHADTRNVNQVLDDIEDKLISSSVNPDYIASKPMSKIAEDAVVAQVVKHFTTKSGKPDMRYKVNKQAAANNAKRKKKKERDKLNLFAAGKFAKARSTSAKSKGRRVKVQTKTNQQQEMGDVLALKELINKMLPEALLAKMQAPALVNRTGRFRESAEVTNAVVGPRGGTQLEYTYQREPYEVFEPGSGSPLANQYRDPRRIIGSTVREIAQQIMGKKFVRVRRV